MRLGHQQPPPFKLEEQLRNRSSVMARWVSPLPRRIHNARQQTVHTHGEGAARHPPPSAPGRHRTSGAPRQRDRAVVGGPWARRSWRAPLRSSGRAPRSKHPGPSGARGVNARGVRRRRFRRATRRQYARAAVQFVPSPCPRARRIPALRSRAWRPGSQEGEIAAEPSRRRTAAKDGGVDAQGAQGSARARASAGAGSDARLGTACKAMTGAGGTAAASVLRASLSQHGVPGVDPAGLARLSGPGRPTSRAFRRARAQGRSRRAVASRRPRARIPVGYPPLDRWQRHSALDRDMTHNRRQSFATYSGRLRCLTIIGQ